MPSPKTKPANTETIQAMGLRKRPGEMFTGCWFMKTVRESKAKRANPRSINHRPPRRISSVNTKKIANNSIFNLNMYQ